MQKLNTVFNLVFAMLILVSTAFAKDKIAVVLSGDGAQTMWPI